MQEKLLARGCVIYVTVSHQEGPEDQQAPGTGRSSRAIRLSSGLEMMFEPGMTHMAL